LRGCPVPCAEQPSPATASVQPDVQTEQGKSPLQPLPVGGKWEWKGRSGGQKHWGAHWNRRFLQSISRSQYPLFSRCPRPPPPARCPCPRSPQGPRPHLRQACADLPLRASWGPCQPGICWWCWTIPSGKPGPVIRLEAPSATNQFCRHLRERHGHCAPRYSYTQGSAGVCQCIRSRQSQGRSRYGKPCTPPSSTVAGHPDLVPVSSPAPELGLAGSGQAQECQSIHPSAPVSRRASTRGHVESHDDPDD
jgi:hypothetical protein